MTMSRNESIAEMFAALKKHNRFDDIEDDIKYLKKRVENLEKENKMLRDMLEFAPGGDGYLKTKEHFEKTVELQINSINSK